MEVKGLYSKEANAKRGYNGCFAVYIYNIGTSRVASHAVAYTVAVKGKPRRRVTSRIKQTQAKKSSTLSLSLSLHIGAPPSVKALSVAQAFSSVYVSWISLILLLCVSVFFFSVTLFLFWVWGSLVWKRAFLEFF